MGFTQSDTGLIITVGSILNTVMQKPSSKLSQKKWFSMKIINMIALLSVVFFGFSYEMGYVILLLATYMGYNTLAGLLPTAQLSEVTENSIEKGSSAGGFGIALSINRLIASNVASLGGLIDIGFSPIVASIELATGVLLGISILSFFINNKKVRL